MNTTQTRLLSVVTIHFGAIETPESDVMDAQVLRDLKPDSLDLVELMMALEDEFDITITDDEALALSEETTLRDLLARIDAKLGEKANG